MSIKTLNNIISKCTLLCDKALIALFAIVCTSLSGQFIPTPPVIDGVISANEYGIHVDGQNQQGSSGGFWFMTWDANNLYVAITNSVPWEGGIIYIDANPIVPVNGGSGSDGSLNWAWDYDRTRLIQPIRSDFKLYFKDSYNEFRYSDGAGSWATNTANTVITSANYVTNTIEMVIPWNTVTNGMGRPSSFNWFGYKMYNNGDGNNGTYHPVPNWNPTTPNNAVFGQNNDVFVPYYFSILNTDNNTSTKPFSAKSLTYHEDNSAVAVGGFPLGNKTLHDVTINDNSSDNSDNDPGNDLYNNFQIANRVLITDDVEINNDLYIGQGSALFPADNSSGSVDVTITMNGSSGNIFNYGRLDCTPEVINPGDWDQRRLNFVFDGTTTLEPTTIFKDRYRFSNITINSNADFRSSSAGSASIELQYGTLDNNGTINFNMGLTGAVNVGLRGESPQLNNYYLKTTNGLGSFIFNDLLIGRFSSTLQPALNGGTMVLQIRGDFENYSDFIGQNGTGMFTVRMNGQGRQEIKGDVTETVNDRTVFQNLIIDNNNGLNNDNAGSDVHFVSEGGGQVDYFVNGVFQLVSGDLVTRDRVDPSIVHDLYIGDGAFMAAPGATSYNGSNNSCFIDGPMSYILLNRPSITLEYPIGKDSSYRNTLFTCFNANSPDTLIYTGEVFHESAYTLNNAIPTTPELIENISLVHYWNIEVNDPGLFNSGFIWMDYDQIFTDDGVTDPANLRILKAPAGGNSAWENISVGTGGVGVGTGSILSNQFFSLAGNDFTLGNIGTNPLPIELIHFDAKKEGNSVRIDWSTASEINNSHFEILSSSDGVQFEKIEHVLGAGNSSQVVQYNTFDHAPNEGWNYYKLLQVDLDGTEWESEVKSVFFEGSSDILIYPNPFIDVLNFNGQGNMVRVRVFDNAGKLIFEQGKALSDRVEVSTSSWASGTYFVRVITENGGLHRSRVIKP